MARHFLDIHLLDAADLRSILDDAHARKAARKGWPQGRADADAPAKDAAPEPARKRQTAA